jgi:hypothetical protein
MAFSVVARPQGGWWAVSGSLIPPWTPHAIRLCLPRSSVPKQPLGKAVSGRAKEGWEFRGWVGAIAVGATAVGHVVLRGADGNAVAAGGNAVGIMATGSGIWKQGEMDPMFGECHIQADHVKK